MVARHGDGMGRVEPIKFNVLRQKVATGRHELLAAYVAPQEQEVVDERRAAYSSNVGRLVAGYVAGRPLGVVEGPGGETDEEVRLLAPRAREVLTAVLSEQQVKRRDELRGLYRSGVRAGRPLRRMWLPLSQEEQANDPASALIRTAGMQGREHLRDFQGDTGPEELLGQYVIGVMTRYPEVIGTADLMEVTTGLLAPQLAFEQTIARASFGSLPGSSE